ncbi:MAG TPA: hypothetical protein VFH70_01355 [Acidimicrobiales bacterium]|nr:hypothetical protein [Acidimicrobiales bacterium]
MGTAAMCRELESLRQSIADYAKSFDARSLTPGQARRLVGVCSQILSSVTSVKSMAAAVAAQSDSYKAEGYRSPEEQLARQAGMSPTQARRALATGRRMLDQPEVAAAALSGELSAEQAAAVSAGAEANPTKTKELIELARDSSMAELSEAVARARSEGVDLEARRRAIHARRKLSRFTDPEGVYHAFLSGNPEDGITMDQVLTEIRRKLTTNRRDRQIPNETFNALDYDAMVALFDLACGKDSEVTLAELIDIGLFPQFDPSSLTPSTVRTTPAQPANRQAADPAATNGPAGPMATDPAASNCPAGPTATDSAGRPAAVDSRSATGRAGPAHAGDLFSLPQDDGGPPPSAATEEPPTGSPPGSSLPDPPPDAPAEPVRSGSKKRRRLAGRPAKIIIRIDLDTLLRGYPIEGEICDSPGYGPIPVSLVHDLMGAGQARLAGFITTGKELRAVHLDRRHPNEYQKAALDFLYPVCAVKGCNTRAGLEADHRTDWNKTHYTAIDLLDYLCWHHHQLKSRHNWALIDGHGKRDFVPPDDPRHPRHQHRSHDGAPPHSGAPHDGPTTSTSPNRRGPAPTTAASPHAGPREPAPTPPHPPAPQPLASGR